MKKDIKEQIESYVLEEFKGIQNLSTSEDDMKIKKGALDNIKTLVEILQKEDINISSHEINKSKINTDITKIQNEYEINCRKIEVDINRDSNNLNLESRKIDVTEIKNNSDVEIKKEELSKAAMKDVEDRTDRLIKICVDGAAIIIPIIFYNVWMNKGFKFEETGTYTSNTFKNLFNKFKPTK